MNEQEAVFYLSLAAEIIDGDLSRVPDDLEYYVSTNDAEEITSITFANVENDKYFQIAFV